MKSKLIKASLLVCMLGGMLFFNISLGRSASGSLEVKNVRALAEARRTPYDCYTSYTNCYFWNCAVVLRCQNNDECDYENIEPGTQGGKGTCTKIE